ncbi:LPS-assembly protein LptD [Roseinatronobacter alkalisoli]|uniref:LPS-assembly protein LptD n=1 Tax=Roseinatronobacter alkalisoli TaxID=3028235 RepID=A0ABT5T813_9RHOB|nr:LPS assembly protein LptD [Roseinatronobacter sp. HJB301]MDD7971265.1 LPS assembly protein LptD [Roseinatronobacter sp. HJB301]
MPRACPQHRRELRSVARSGCAALVLACALALAAPLPVSAQVDGPEQGFATLVADRLYLDGPHRLIAEGNVEALSGQTRMRATRIIYDRQSGALQIEGPLTLREGDRVLVLADAAEMHDGFRRGLIRSARVILDQQLQIAAHQVERVDDRFTQMNSVIASACEICEETQTPLWEVRASRVVHDQQEQQIYFENAQFRLFGLPVAYLPRLRVPDPGLDRATGWLSPRFSLDTGHGVGLRAPYFIAISHDKDLTLTPFLASKGSRALELRYRQAFATGMLELGGLVARDSIRPGSTRAMGYTRGEFVLGRGYELSFNLIKVSDRQLLEDYDRSEAQLASDITLERVRRDERIRLQALQFRSLRLVDNNRELPNQIGQAVYERRFDMPGLGGVAGLRFEVHSHSRRRPLAADVKSVARFSADLDWRRDAILPAGVVGTLGVNLGVDHFAISPGSTAFAKSTTRVVPTAMAELRWPLVRATSGGAVHVVEPVAQVIWGRDRVDALPNDISSMPELDEGNLFSHSRFAARDQREMGLRANLGLSWTRHDPQGWSGTLTLGRIWRKTDLGQFSPQSALAGRRSDWLLVSSLDTDQGLTLSNRALFNSDFRLTRNALELDWSTPDYSISTTYMHIRPDLAENRPAKAAEWSLDGSRALDEYWTASVNWRYDIARNRAARVGAGLTFENECLRMQMEVERRFASAITAGDTTSFGLSIDVLGVGGNPSRARRGCSGG